MSLLISYVLFGINYILKPLLINEYKSIETKIDVINNHVYQIIQKDDRTIIVDFVRED